MTRYAALLRGINLGRHNRIAMADLRSLLSGLGYSDVRTHLQSGNAVLSAADTDPDTVRARIEAALSDTLGMDVLCLVRDQDQLRSVIDGHPFPDIATNGSRMMAMFLSEAPDPALLTAHDPVALDPDRVRLGDRVIYQWCPDGLMAAPPVGAYAEKHLGVAVTARNWNTVTKLGEFLGA